ncbi:hypothetical protein ZIOFF_056413 [Zingiber officinale]|uniref:Uncharacterized protein n=1 Tax=Zingiber officinale TaxID=94328 RepID=A0A8J5KPE4_ZINOF|nr:hypothetical protein ZIOFF_056413 [Zingiber officinale]
MEGLDGDDFMEKILERYEHYTYAEKTLKSPDLESQASNGRTTGFLESQRTPTVRASAGNFSKACQSQVMFDSIAELQRKERALREQNKNLEQELTEKKQRAHREQDRTSPVSSPPLIAEPQPTLIMGCHQGRGGGDGPGQAAAQTQVRISGSLLPPWMLHHLSG